MSSQPGLPEFPEKIRFQTSLDKDSLVISIGQIFSFGLGLAETKIERLGLPEAGQNEQQKARKANEKATKAKSVMPDLVDVIKKPGERRSHQI